MDRKSIATVKRRKRPVRPNREEGHAPARPRPGARSARRDRWLFHSIADRPSAKDLRHDTQAVSSQRPALLVSRARRDRDRLGGAAVPRPTPAPDAAGAADPGAIGGPRRALGHA